MLQVQSHLCIDLSIFKHFFHAPPYNHRRWRPCDADWNLQIEKCTQFSSRWIFSLYEWKKVTVSIVESTGKTYFQCISTKKGKLSFFHTKVKSQEHKRVANVIIGKPHLIQWSLKNFTHKWNQIHLENALNSWIDFLNIFWYVFVNYSKLPLIFREKWIPTTSFAIKWLKNCLIFWIKIAKYIYTFWYENSNVRMSASALKMPFFFYAKQKCCRKKNWKSIKK